MATLLLFSVAGLAVASGRPVGPRCEPITYTLQGSLPSDARADFGVAIEEMHQRTGLVFEEGDPNASKLRVVWSDHGVTSATSSPIVSERGTTRVLGYGTGRWRSVQGGSELVDASVEIDATASWPVGIDRGDGLAAVFVHELGHIAGLTHSPEPTSFMYHRISPQPRTWTAQDLDQLARAGRQSGCRPPHAA